MTWLTDRGRAWWKQAIGLVLVPLLVVGGLLAATWSSDSRLHRVEAAVVNLDEAVTLNGQVVPLGRQLSAALIDSNRDQNFTWILADESHAKSGLESGRYAAVVTIPVNFSAAATSFSGAAGDAKQAVIKVQTSPVAGIADTALGQNVAQAAAMTLNRTLTQTYLDNVYIGMNEMGKQFQTVADAAKQLSDGTTQLSDGLGQAAPGAASLASGLDQMAQNTSALKSGGKSLSDGVKQYTDGIGEASTGAAKLASGAGQLSAASPQLRSGGAQLVTGAGDLATGLGTFTTGLTSYIQGATQLATSTKQQLALMIQLRILLDQITGSSNPDLSAYVPQIQAGIAALQQQLDTAQVDTTQLAGMVGTVQTRIDSTIDATATQVAAACPDQVKQLGDAACQGYAAGVKAMAAAGKTAVQQAFTTPDPKTGMTLQQGLKQLSSALGSMSNTQLAAILKQVKTILSLVEPMLSQGAKIPTTAELQAQSAQLDAMIAAGPQLVSGATQLTDGATQLRDGVSAYVTGVGTYTDGVDQLADGTTQLATGLKVAADNGPTLAAGVKTYVDGVGRLADGIDVAAPGAAQLADGVKQASDGAVKLADGSKQLSDGLAKGAGQVPSYSQADRESLTKVVASPVSVSELDGLVSPTASLAAILIVVGLWVGGLTTYTVLPAIRRKLAMSSRPGVAVLGTSMLPGFVIAVVEALVVAGVGQAFVRLPAARFATLAMLLSLVALSFFAVNHALAAWGGGVGRLIAVGLAVVTVATAVTAAVPAWFDALRPLSPLSPAYDAVRAVISGGPGVTGPAFTLAGWLILGLAATSVAVLRARTVRQGELAALT